MRPKWRHFNSDLIIHTRQWAKVVASYKQCSRFIILYRSFLMLFYYFNSSKKTLSWGLCWANQSRSTMKLKWTWVSRSPCKLSNSARDIFLEVKKGFSSVISYLVILTVPGVRDSWPQVLSEIVHFFYLTFFLQLDLFLQFSDFVHLNCRPVFVSCRVLPPLGDCPDA